MNIICIVNIFHLFEITSFSFGYLKRLTLNSLDSFEIHDDVIKWKHFPRYWPFVRGILRSPVNSPHKGQWRGALVFLFDLHPNKPLSKQWSGWWFETPPCPLLRHPYVLVSIDKFLKIWCAHSTSFPSLACIHIVLSNKYPVFNYTYLSLIKNRTNGAICTQNELKQTNIIILL